MSAHKVLTVTQVLGKLTTTGIPHTYFERCQGRNGDVTESNYYHAFVFHLVILTPCPYLDEVGHVLRLPVKTSVHCLRNCGPFLTDLRLPVEEAC